MAAPRAIPVPADPAAKLTREFVTPEGVDLRLQLGSAGERAGAFLLDFMFIVLILAALFLLVSLALLTEVISKAVGQLSGPAQFAVMIWILGFFLLRNGYFIIFEVMPRAATPGKMIMGLRVAARDGGRLTSDAIFARNAMREIEVFLPLTFIAAAQASGDPVDGWMVLLGLAWTGVFLFFPLFNRDRLRVGDLLAGTWVVKAPRRRLLADLAADAAAAPPLEFTPEQVQAYGVKELHVLEDVLRRRDPKTLAAVAERIRAKIHWTRGPSETDTAFLSAYYAALRGRLESRLLFGHRRKDKFDKA